MVEGNIEVSRKKLGLLNVELVHLLVHKCGGLCEGQKHLDKQCGSQAMKV
jgi:hypothetical protein